MAVDRKVFAIAALISASIHSTAVASSALPGNKHPVDGLSVEVSTRTPTSPISAGYAPLTDCDRYASYVFDEERVDVPVPFEEIDTGRALPACQVAVKTYPGSARLEALLGRVLLKAGDRDQAEEWYYKAAIQGHLAGQHALARILHEKEEFHQSAQWLILAAESGFFVSQGLLGDYYANGIGVSKNMAQAVKWWRFAAEQGDKESQVSLGDAYLSGLGITENHAKAVKWYLVASQSNNESAVQRMDWAMHNLPIDAIAQGSYEASEWRAKTWSEARASHE